ncbi:MAG: hypothetical protein AAF194_03005, partial [Pseudomonadota bacterium]
MARVANSAKAHQQNPRFRILSSLCCQCVLSLLLVTVAWAQETKRPNILVIWGDDIGISNISAYSDGM